MRWLDRGSESSWASASRTTGEPKRRIAPKALDRFKERVRELTRRTRGVSLRADGRAAGTLPDRLARLLRLLPDALGAAGPGRVDSPATCACVVWKQWRTGRDRFAELRARGVGQDLAAKAAGSPDGPWRISRSPAVQHRAAQRLSSTRSAFLDLAAPPTRLTNRTAVVRTRMPGGVGGEPPRGAPLSRLDRILGQPRPAANVGPTGVSAGQKTRKIGAVFSGRIDANSGVAALDASGDPR